MSTDACELDGKLAARPSQPGTQSLLDPGRNVAQLLGVNGCDYETNQSAVISRRLEWECLKTWLLDDSPDPSQSLLDEMIRLCIPSAATGHLRMWLLIHWQLLDPDAERRHALRTILREHKPN